MSPVVATLRRRLALWLPPAVLLVAGGFLWIREVASGRASGAALEGPYAAAVAERDKARAEEERLAALAEALAHRRREVEALYGDHFSTERVRFTDLVREIKRLAEHSGLDPKEIGFPEESLDGFDLARRSFLFNVEGSYANLRMFLHLLELSPSFVTVNQIRVRERSGRGLNASLQLSTFFVEPEPRRGGRG